jgi:hypothetical protein
VLRSFVLEAVVEGWVAVLLLRDGAQLGRLVG